jgi:hypothetical protein
MDFDSLLNYCVKLNNSTNEKCLVCHIPIENKDEHLKLLCNHIFHKNCIGYKTGSIKCLYCEKKSIPEIINGPSVNKQNQLSCKVVLKTGPNKGQYCSRPECNYHKLQTTSVVVINPVNNQKSKLTKNTSKKNIKLNQCNVILKTGIKSGQTCGRELPCKYHKEKLITPDNSIQINKLENEITSNQNFTNGIIEDHIDVSDTDDLIEV